MRKILGAALCILVGFTSGAQQKWNLRTIVDYAMANNISVKMSEVQAKVAAVNLRQDRLSQIPNANLQANLGYNSGNNQDPITFQRVTQTYLSSGIQLQSSADVFNFFSKRNRIAASEWEYEASNAYVNKVKNDIALTAANGYLQVLLAMEQEKIMEVQVKQTMAQLDNTRKMVDAGTLPPLNATQLEAQLAVDSGNYVSAKGNTTLALLTLKSYMNIDAGAAFEIETPPVDLIPLEPIADLQPEYVYALAVANQPQQKYNELRIKAAVKSKDAAKGSMLPSLGIYGSLGSNFISARTPNYVPEIGALAPNGSFVNVNGTSYAVQSPTITYVKNGYVHNDPYFTQLSNNFSQGVGISLTVPIFSGYNLHSNYERAKLNINTLNLQKDMDNQKLKQDIYQAYTSAVTAMEKFNASKKAVDAAEQTFSFAGKRYNVGLLGTYDMITSQNNLLRAKLDYSINHFDYVFKMKVLEFYKGLGLKL
jgi:outer membrane protein